MTGYGSWAVPRLTSCFEWTWNTERGSCHKSYLLTMKSAPLLREEPQRLTTVQRPRTIDAIAAAREGGNIEGNPGVTVACDKHVLAEERISTVESKLTLARIIDPSTGDAQGRVAFGATGAVAQRGDG